MPPLATHKRKSLTLTSAGLLHQHEEPNPKRFKAVFSGEDTADFDQSGSYSRPTGETLPESKTRGPLDTKMDSLRSKISSRTQSAPQQPKLITESRSISFASLGVIASLQRALNLLSIRIPTEIQVACIAPIIAGRSQKKFAL